LNPSSGGRKTSNPNETNREKAPIHTSWYLGKAEKELLGRHGAVITIRPARMPEVASRQRREGATSGYPAVHLTQGMANVSGLP
jgi:hypothetical protein